jgi:ABC-type glutathione transport system ATPase component
VRRELRIALVIVTHDRDLPAGVVDRVVRLAGGRVVDDTRSTR